MLTRIRVVSNAIALGVVGAVQLAAGNAHAEVSTVPAVPMVIPHGQKDVSLVPSGTYSLDPNHVGVIARVSHLGFSFSIFRFGRAAATLVWDHDRPEHSKLSATVQTSSIATNVEGFAAQLTGDKYLNSAKWPEAQFVSTVFHQVDATHGTVDGKFTLMGKMRPVTFDVALVGAGPGFAGGPVMGHVIGIHAETGITPTDYGLSPLFKDPIAIVIDTEFDKKP
jgi:polyisoprenoid-binding protein YceI